MKQEAGTFVGGVDDPDNFPIDVYKHENDSMYSASEPYWQMGAVVEDDVLLTHTGFDNHRTIRSAYWNSTYRSRWVDDMVANRVHIAVSPGEPPILRPHTRKLRNRYGMIKDTLLAGLQPPTANSNWNAKDLGLLMDTREWWDLAWAYALTDAAKRVVDCNNKIASSLTAVSFDNLTNLDSKLEAIRERVTASDFEAAKKLFTPLEEQIDKLSTLINSTSQRLSSAGHGLCDARLPDQKYRLTEEPDKKDRYLFDDDWYSAVVVHTKGGESLVTAFDSLVSLFNKIGLPISAPYGVEICPENMGQLAVLNETIKEVILTSPYDEAETEDNKEQPVALLG